MKRPEEVTLSREEGEALIERIERNALSAEDRRVLVKVLTFYFWLLFALREAKLSLKRLKALVFGEKPKKREPPPAGGTPSGGARAARGADGSLTQGGEETCYAGVDRGEATSSRAWAARRGGLSGGANGRVST